MADVFLSYQHGDRASVEQVDAALKAAGISTWWDADIQAGARWDQEIRVQHKAARCVVVLWSERSWESDYVQSEASRGHTRRILVAARLDDVDVDIPFNLVQTVDLRTPGGLDALVAGVRAKLAAAPAVPTREVLAAERPEPVRRALSTGPTRRTHVIAADEDRNRVLREVAILRQEGIAVHYEPSTEVLSAAAQTSISAADAVFVFWSSAARRDPRVEAELEFAEVVGRMREAAGQAGREGFLTPVSLDGTELPAELSTKPGRIGATVWLSLASVGAMGAWAWRADRATGGTWSLLALAAALALGVGLLQVMRRGDRLLRAGRVYAAGRWLDRARAVELIAASEAFLDRIFGKRVLSFRSFFVSALVSLLSVAPVIAVWWFYFRDAGLAGGMTPADATSLARVQASTIAVEGAGPLAIGNVAFDFLSLLVTRTALKRIVARPSPIRLTVGLTLDATMAALCALGAMFTYRWGAQLWDGWWQWPQVVVSTAGLALTGGIRFANVTSDTFIGPVLVTGLATLTSMLPSLVHGTLLAVALANRLLAHLPLRGLGEVLRRTADSPRGPWSLALPLLVAALAGAAWAAAAPVDRADRELAAGRWRTVDPLVVCGTPCVVGSPATESGRDRDEDQRALDPVPPPFRLLDTEVWQDLWAEVWDAAGPDRYGLPRTPSVYVGGQLPVTNVSWCDAARFANLWSRVEGRAPFYTSPDAPDAFALPRCEAVGAVRRAEGTGYRLPTEEEWEVAARGGTTTAYWAGDGVEDLTAVDWVSLNSGMHPHPVLSVPTARGRAHPLGLRGVHGNVAEWTESLYDPSDSPGGWRVLRGGAWVVVAVFARAADRWSDDVVPWGRYPSLGFRLARPLAPQPAGP